MRSITADSLSFFAANNTMEKKKEIGMKMADMKKKVASNNAIIVYDFPPRTVLKANTDFWLYAVSHHNENRWTS